MSIPIEWVDDDKPSDANQWERIIQKVAEEGEGISAVKMRKTDAGWFLETARTVPTQIHIGQSGDPVPPFEPQPVDFRWHVTEALKKAGKQVIGVDMLQGGPPLSPEREAAIRSAAKQLTFINLPMVGAARFDVQVVADLLAEVDRLRAKLQLAAHSRDLTGEAASKLRNACDDITPRPSRFRKALPPGPNE